MSHYEGATKVGVDLAPFPVTTPSEIIAMIVLPLVMGLFTVSGIGGVTVGVLLVVYFMGFQIQQAIAITNLVIFMCAATRCLWTVGDRHPEKPHVVMIDFSMATILMGVCLAGNQVGLQILQVQLSPLILTIIHDSFLFVLICASIYKSYVWRQKEKAKSVASKLVKSNPDIDKNLLESEIELVTPGGGWEIVEPEEAPKANGHKNKIYTINGVEFDTNEPKNKKSELE